MLTDIYDSETLSRIIEEVGLPTVVQLQGYAEPHVVDNVSNYLHALGVYVVKTISTSEALDRIVNYIQK